MRNYQALKNTHLDLMNEYIEILNRIDSLPLFIDFTSFRKVEEIKSVKPSITFSLKKNIKLTFRPIIKFLVWRPLTKLYIEAHIHSKLREISRIYIQIAQALDIDNKTDKAKIEWLLSASKSCETFSSTLFSWSSLKGNAIWLINIFTGILVASFGAANIFQVISGNNWAENFSLIIYTGIQSLVLSVIYGLSFYSVLHFSFFAKRVLFYPNADLPIIKEQK